VAHSPVLVYSSRSQLRKSAPELLTVAEAERKRNEDSGPSPTHRFPGVLQSVSPLVDVYAVSLDRQNDCRLIGDIYVAVAADRAALATPYYQCAFIEDRPSCGAISLDHYDPTIAERTMLLADDGGRSTQSDVETSLVRSHDLYFRSALDIEAPLEHTFEP
jgi:hypothetical protein